MFFEIVLQADNACLNNCQLQSGRALIEIFDQVHLRVGIITFLIGLVPFAAQASGDQNPDPLASVMWPEMHQRLLDSGPVVFDERVRVIAPTSAENSLNVPVKVDASALGQVRRLIVFADLNPIPKIIELEPLHARPVLSFNFKVQQATPLHAAALDTAGVWHVGGVWLDAAGGGCTQPSVGSAAEDWARQVGSTTARIWPTAEGQRLRLRIMHPMDTGLADRIPAFFIERVEVMGDGGRLLARLHLFEPLAENPVLTLDLATRGDLELFARDNNGMEVRALVAAAP